MKERAYAYKFGDVDYATPIHALVDAETGEVYARAHVEPRVAVTVFLGGRVVEVTGRTVLGAYSTYSGLDNLPGEAVFLLMRAIVEIDRALLAARDAQHAAPTTE